MTTQVKHFFEQPREWSKRKHELLRKYLPQFARILGRSERTVFIVDAFAGRGNYGTGDSRQPGSPVQAVMLAKELAAAPNRSYNLRCINVEADTTSFNDLVRNTSDYGPFVQNYHGTFAAHLNTVLTAVGASPALFFLDPFGLSGLQWETLARIAARPGKTELLFNLNVPKFDRHAGWLDSFEQKHRGAFIDLLNRVTGTDEWQDIWTEERQDIWGEPLEVWERYRLIMQFYRDRIEKLLKFRVGTYPIRTVKSGQLKYYMVFASRHPLAMRIMSSIVYSTEEEYLDEREKGSDEDNQQLKLFDMAPIAQISLRETSAQHKQRFLEEEIMKLIQTELRMRFDQLQDALMKDWFGRVAEKHYRAACRTLINQHLITANTKAIKDDTILSLGGTIH